MSPAYAGLRDRRPFHRRPGPAVVLVAIAVAGFVVADTLATAQDGVVRASRRVRRATGPAMPDDEFRFDEKRIPEVDERAKSALDAERSVAPRKAETRR